MLVLWKSKYTQDSFLRLIKVLQWITEPKLNPFPPLLPLESFHTTSSAHPPSLSHIPARRWAGSWESVWVSTSTRRLRFSSVTSMSAWSPALWRQWGDTSGKDSGGDYSFWLATLNSVISEWKEDHERRAAHSAGTSIKGKLHSQDDKTASRRLQNVLKRRSKIKIEERHKIMFLNVWQCGWITTHIE